jgi:hypothetical protein
MIFNTPSACGGVIGLFILGPGLALGLIPFIMIFNTPSACGGVIGLFILGPGLALGLIPFISLGSSGI